MSKKIKFSSIINQNGEINKIEFESKLLLNNDKYESSSLKSYLDNFDIYEFIEPQNNVMNRIEISEDAINIFSGSSTINLKLGREIKINYNTQSGIVILTSYMNKLERNDNKVYFEYSLANKNEKIGEYSITLDIF